MNKMTIRLSKMTMTVFKMSCFSSPWVQCADREQSLPQLSTDAACCVYHEGPAVWWLTSKLDGGPLADHGAIRVGGHTGVLSFVLVPDGVADDQVAIHHTVMVWLCVQINFNIILQPTATKQTRVKSWNWSLSFFFLQFLTITQLHHFLNLNLYTFF